MPPPSKAPTQIEIAGYIEDMLAELAELASAHDLRSLATGLRMMALEAARQANSSPSGD